MLPERATVLIVERFRALGYIGRWQVEDPRNRVLSQSRGHMWGLFLLVQLQGPNPLEAADARERDVDEAISLLKIRGLRSPALNR